MCVGIFLSVLQVELSSGGADLEPVQVGVFMQEVAEWNCCHREMCPPLGTGFT